ncbi:MAG: DUF998 domain-containing protein [Kineosporiaceae bacterium]
MAPRVPSRLGGGVLDRPARPPRPAVAASAAIAAVTCYVLTTVIGAALTPGYSHLHDAVSTLTSPGSPHRDLLALGYVAYNLAVALFALDLARLPGAGVTLRVAAGLTVVGSASGIAQVTAFPQDDPGTPITGAGAAHIGLASLSALITVVVALLTARGLGRLPGGRAWSRFSLGCAVAILTTGAVAGIAVHTSWMGAAERLPIGAFLVWLAGLAAALLGGDLGRA